ncbi:MAG: molybdopterin molybdotransferase MoeA [Candidatus Bathyarchaeota archaeon]|nr:molybdopterin molybdotransferase MoeA [Candidatus Bathyarchaeota archaeon A05DMB-3]MDH7606445.1 molybdopterin molybdotransferase MoeA [Candidatus Bathyarchaeota archaeon]
MVRLRGFQKLMSIEEARQRLMDGLKIKRKNVMVSIYDALNRVLAEDIIAEEDLPRFDRSAVDGYAVKAEDTFGVSQFKPKTLKLTNGNEVKKGEAKQVWTGNSLPKGADAVLMLENAKRFDDEIEVWTVVTPGENVSKKGEDIAKGEIAVKAGTRLKPHHLGLIAALGKSEICVFEKPKVAVLATGNELVETGQKPREEQVFEVNRLVLGALCLELGAEPLDLGIAKDDVAEIAEKIRFGLEKADMVLTTGGTSVGASDLVPTAVNSIGKPGVIVHGVAMRPAMPTALAIIDNKPIIVLSGNPVAAMFGFEVFARPLILKMLGVRCERRPVVNARLTRRTTTALGRRTFVRIRVFQRGGEFYAEPVSARGSGIISTMTRANGYVVVPENREGLEEGETVQVHLFDTLEEADESV